MKEITIVLVALYRFQNFPVRILHGVLERVEGVKAHSIFFKDRGTIMTNHITLREEKLLGGLVAGLKPSLVGISVLSPFVSAAKKVTRIVRDNSSAAVIWGGLHPTIYPENCVDEADMLCIGEGEGAIEELARHMRDGRPCHSIRNLWVKKEGRMLKNQMRPLIQDMDLLPFASRKRDSYYFIESGKASKTDSMLSDSRFFIQSSRGCPFTCAYCINGILRGLYRDLGSYIRTRTVDNVIKEIKENNQASYVSFSDEVFGMDEKWLDEFKKKYKAEVALPFCIECNPRTLNSAMIGKLSAAGVETINFGIQTGSDEIRNKIFDRPGRNSEIVKVAAEIGARGINISCDFILDNPYDTEESLKEAIDVILQLPRPSIFFVHSLQYFPNYPLTKRAVADGHIKADDARAGASTEKTIREWAFFPRFRPFDKKQVLQNVIWLIVNNLEKDEVIKYAVFGNTPLSKACLAYLNIKSIILGWFKNTAEYLGWKNAGFEYLMNGARYTLRGDFKLVYGKIKKHIRPNRENAYEKK